MTDRRPPWLPRLGRRAWLALGMNMIACLGSGLTMPFLILYLHLARGFSLPTAGLVLGATGIAGLITTPMTGPLIDRIGALPAFVAGLLGGGAGMALYTVATTVPLALLAAIVYGLASGLMWNGFATLLTQIVPAAERGAVFAVRYMSASVAFGAGALLTGFIAVSARPGPYVAVLLADAASYVLFAVALIAMRGTFTADETAGPEPDVGYRQVLRDRALLGALLVNSLLMVFAIAQTTAVFAAWVTGGGGSTTRVVGIAFAVNIAVLLASQLPAIRRAQGRSRLAGAAQAAGIFAASWIVLILPTTLGITGVARDLLMIGSLGVFAIGEATLSPTLPALINDLAPDQLRGRYNAIFNLSNQIGPVLAPPLAGLALGHDLGQPFLYALAAVCAATGGLSLALRRITSRMADRGPVLAPSTDPLTADSVG
jgi:MFS family permease